MIKKIFGLRLKSGMYIEFEDGRLTKGPSNKLGLTVDEFFGKNNKMTKDKYIREKEEGKLQQVFGIKDYEIPFENQSKILLSKKQGYIDFSDKNVRNFREYNNEIGKKYFDRPTTEYIDEYVRFSKNAIIPDEIKYGVLSSQYKTQEPITLYSGVDVNYEPDERDVVLSTSLQEGVAQNYDKRVIKFLVEKDSYIISTYNAYNGREKDNAHFKYQAEIILPLRSNKIVKLDNNTYLVRGGNK